MKEIWIKYIVILCCSFIIPFSSYAQDVNLSSQNKTYSEIESKKEEKLENSEDDINIAIGSENIQSFASLKGNITMDRLMECYNEIKDIKIKREIAPQENTSKENFKDIIWNISSESSQYFLAFLKHNVVYLIILTILFLLLIADKEGRCKPHGRIQSRVNRPKDKKCKKGR